MNVLVDTGVWSLALRRRQISQDPKGLELRELIREGRAHVIGPIRQEVLSGIREKAQFDRLRDHLREFPDLPVRTADHERAAEFFNVCRSRESKGRNTDFVICAVADRLRHGHSDHGRRLPPVRSACPDPAPHAARSLVNLIGLAQSDLHPPAQTGPAPLPTHSSVPPAVAAPFRDPGRGSRRGEPGAIAPICRWSG